MFFKNEIIVIIVFLVVGVYEAFTDILGFPFTVDQLPKDTYTEKNFGSALQSEFTLLKIWVNEDKTELMKKPLILSEKTSEDFFYILQNSQVAYILASMDLVDIEPVLSKAKGSKRLRNYKYKNI